MEGRDGEVRKVKATISFEEWEQSWEIQWKTSGSVSVRALRRCRVYDFTMLLYYGYIHKSRVGLGL